MTIRTAALSWLPAFLVAAVAVLARADGQLFVEELGIRRGRVCAVLRLVDAFESDTRSSIERGLPITVRFTTEIWRERRRWWDQQIDSRVASFRVRWDPGDRRFALLSSGRRRRTETFETLDALLEELSRRTVEVHPRWNLEDRHRYYVAVEVAIQPLTLEEFRELDGWISGRIRGDEPPSDGDGDGGGVSGAVFGFLVDLSGFGDTILRARTPSFRPPDLEDLPPEG